MQEQLSITTPLIDTIRNENSDSIISENIDGDDSVAENLSRSNHDLGDFSDNHINVVNKELKVNGEEWQDEKIVGVGRRGTDISVEKQPLATEEENDSIQRSSNSRKLLATETTVFVSSLSSSISSSVEESRSSPELNERVVKVEAEGAVDNSKISPEAALTKPDTETTRNIPREPCASSSSRSIVSTTSSSSQSLSSSSIPAYIPTESREDIKAAARAVALGQTVSSNSIRTSKCKQTATIASRSVGIDLDINQGTATKNKISISMPTSSIEDVKAAARAFAFSSTSSSTSIRNGVLSCTKKERKTRNHSKDSRAIQYLHPHSGTATTSNCNSNLHPHEYQQHHDGNIDNNYHHLYHPQQPCHRLPLPPPRPTPTGGLYSADSVLASKFNVPSTVIPGMGGKGSSVVQLPAHAEKLRQVVAPLHMPPQQQHENSEQQSQKYSQHHDHEQKQSIMDRQPIPHPNATNSTNPSYPRPHYHSYPRPETETPCGAGDATPRHPLPPSYPHPYSSFGKPPTTVLATNHRKRKRKRQECSAAVPPSDHPQLHPHMKMLTESSSLLTPTLPYQNFQGQQKALNRITNGGRINNNNNNNNGSNNSEDIELDEYRHFVMSLGLEDDDATWIHHNSNLFDDDDEEFQLEEDDDEDEDDDEYRCEDDDGENENENENEGEEDATNTKIVEQKVTATTSTALEMSSVRSRKEKPLNKVITESVVVDSQRVTVQLPEGHSVKDSMMGDATDIATVKTAIASTATTTQFDISAEISNNNCGKKNKDGDGSAMVDTNDNNHDDDDDGVDDESKVRWDSDFYQELEEELGGLEEEDMEAAVATLLLDYPINKKKHQNHQSQLQQISSTRLSSGLDDQDDNEDNDHDENIENFEHRESIHPEQKVVCTNDTSIPAELLASKDSSSPPLLSSSPLGIVTPTTPSISLPVADDTSEPNEAHSKCTASKVIAKSSTSKESGAFSSTNVGKTGSWKTAPSGATRGIGILTPTSAAVPSTTATEVTHEQYEQLQQLLQRHYQLLSQQAVLAVRAAHALKTKKIVPMVPPSFGLLPEKNQIPIPQHQNPGLVRNDVSSSAIFTAVRNHSHRLNSELATTTITGGETSDDLVEILDGAVGMLQDLDQQRKDSIRHHIQFHSSPSSRWNESREIEHGTQYLSLSSNGSTKCDGLGSLEGHKHLQQASSPKQLLPSTTLTAAAAAAGDGCRKLTGVRSSPVCEERRLTRSQFTKTLQQQSELGCSSDSNNNTCRNDNSKNREQKEQLNQRSFVATTVFDIQGLSMLHETFNLIDKDVLQVSVHLSNRVWGQTCRSNAKRHDMNHNKRNDRNILELPTSYEACRHVLMHAKAKIKDELVPGSRDVSTNFVDAKEFFGDNFRPPSTAEQDLAMRRNRNWFTSGEDNLVLRGVNLYGEKQWTLISDRFLPDRSDNIISQRYSKLCLLLYKAHGIQIDEQGNLPTPPKLDSVDEMDEEAVAKLQKVEPPAILNVHRWSLEEDLTLLKAVPLMGSMWAELKARLIPHRDRGHLRKRYQVLERRVKATVTRILKTEKLQQHSSSVDLTSPRAIQLSSKSTVTEPASSVTSKTPSPPPQTFAPSSSKSALNHAISRKKQPCESTNQYLTNNPLQKKLSFRSPAKSPSTPSSDLSKVTFLTLPTAANDTTPRNVAPVGAPTLPPTINTVSTKNGSNAKSDSGRLDVPVIEPIGNSSHRPALSGKQPAVHAPIKTEFLVTHSHSQPLPPPPLANAVSASAALIDAHILPPTNKEVSTKVGSTFTPGPTYDELQSTEPISNIAQHPSEHLAGKLPATPINASGETEAPSQPKLLSHSQRTEPPAKEKLPIELPTNLTITSTTATTTSLAIDDTINNAQTIQPPPGASSELSSIHTELVAPGYLVPRVGAVIQQHYPSFHASSARKQEKAVHTLSPSRIKKIRKVKKHRTLSPSPQDDPQNPHPFLPSQKPQTSPYRHHPYGPAPPIPYHHFHQYNPSYHGQIHLPYTSYPHHPPFHPLPYHYCHSHPYQHHPQYHNNDESSRAAYEKLVHDPSQGWSHLSEMDKILEHDVAEDLAVASTIVTQLAKSPSKPQLPVHHQPEDVSRDSFMDLNFQDTASGLTIFDAFQSNPANTSTAEEQATESVSFLAGVLERTNQQDGDTRHSKEVSVLQPFEGNTNHSLGKRKRQTSLEQSPSASRAISTPNPGTPCAASQSFRMSLLSKVEFTPDSTLNVDEGVTLHTFPGVASMDNYDDASYFHENNTSRTSARRSSPDFGIVKETPVKMTLFGDGSMLLANDLVAISALNALSHSPAKMSLDNFSPPNDNLLADGESNEQDKNIKNEEGVTAHSTSGTTAPSADGENPPIKQRSLFDRVVGNANIKNGRSPQRKVTSKRKRLLF